jgi:ATP-binding cassette, subfamily B, bacterial MsbA
VNMFAPPGRAAQNRKPPTVKDFNQFKRLLMFTKPYRWRLALAIAATLVSSGLGLVFPQVIGKLIDASFLKIGSNDTSSLDGTVLMLFAVFGTQFLFGIAQNYSLSFVAASVVSDLRKAVYAHLANMSITFFENRKTGEITSRLTSDAGTIQGIVSTVLSNLVSQSISLVGSIVILLITNTKLSLVMLSIVPVIVVAAIWFGRRIRKISKEFQDRVAEANGHADEAISGIRVVQSFTAETLEVQRYSQAINASFEVAMRRARLNAFFTPSVFFAMFGAISVVLWFGGRLVIQGEISPGQLTSFLFYTISIAGAIGGLAGLFSQIQEALGASSRIFELLDEKSELIETANPVKLERVQGRVSLEHVSFSYGDRGEGKVLDNVSLEAQPGEVIALVGPSGAGKSTLVTLIPRFYDVSGGKIMIDGIDVRDFSLHDLRSSIGIVPQETQLFSGTIFENIRYGKPDASEFEVKEAAKAANAHDFISSFQDGYETLVGERGVKLSGGQRQRVAIARAILKNPRILILDEATSALDSESESLVQEALERLMQSRTTFVIAHRLSTVRNANRIVVLENGTVTEVGTHEALMTKGGLYKDLYDLQFRSADVANQLEIN